MLFVIGLTAALAEPVDQNILERLASIAPLRIFRMTKEAPTFDADVYEKAARGRLVTGLENVEGQSSKKAWGVGIMNAPIGAVWAALNDDLGQVAYTNIAYSELLAGTPCSSGRKVLEFVHVPLLADRWWINEIRLNTAMERKTHGEVRELAWKTVDDLSLVRSAESRSWVERGMPIDFSHGSWLLVDLDGKRTFAEYFVWGDPGGNVPTAVVNALAQGEVREAFDAMTRLANDGPACSAE